MSDSVTSLDSRNEANLAYNQSSVDSLGREISLSRKKELRQRHGYCLECQGVPVQLYVVKKSRFNPLSKKKLAQNVEGKCANGVCFRCYPHKNPSRNERTSNFTSSDFSLGTSRERHSVRSENSSDSPRRSAWSAPGLFIPEELPKEIPLHIDLMDQSETGTLASSEMFSVKNMRSSATSLGEQSHACVSVDESENSTNSMHAKSFDDGISQPSLPSRKAMSANEIASVAEETRAMIQDMITIAEIELMAEVVLGAMRRYRESSSIQIVCLELINQICEKNESNPSALIACGANEDIIQGMKYHLGDSNVQQAGCLTLRILGSNSDLRSIIIQARACESIHNALKSCLRDSRLAQSAIACLRNFSVETEARQIFQEDGASATVVDVMNIHRSDPSIQRDGCAFLTNIAVNIEKQAVCVVNQSELEAILQAMAFHKDIESVMQEACLALKNFCHNESNCRTLYKCKDVFELVSSAINFEQSCRCVDDANFVMEQLEFIMTIDQSM